MGAAILAFLAVMWTGLVYEAGRISGQQEMLDDLERWMQEADATLEELLERDEP